MPSRVELHEELCTILGSRNVYFQPPKSTLIKYPCIVYSKAGPNTHNANNTIYLNFGAYDGMVIDYDQDSEIVDRIRGHFPKCSLSDCYVVENLHHYPFKLYY